MIFRIITIRSFSHLKNLYESELVSHLFASIFRVYIYNIQFTLYMSVTHMRTHTTERRTLRVSAWVKTNSLEVLSFHCYDSVISVFCKQWKPDPK